MIKARKLSEYKASNHVFQKYLGAIAEGVICVMVIVFS
jgi:hypothetical protein